MGKLLVRYLGEFVVALVVVALVAGLGSILGLTLYATGLYMLLPVFAGPTYLFFILVGLAVGYTVNRQQCSRVAPWVWILLTIWAAYAAAGDLGGGIHRGDSVLGYIWNTLILGNHELALISQWIIGAPILTSVAYSFGAWLAIRTSGGRLVLYTGTTRRAVRSVIFRHEAPSVLRLHISTNLAEFQPLPTGSGSDLRFQKRA